MLKKTLSCFFIGLIFASCSNDLKYIERIEISDIFIDNKLNIRALEIKNNKVYAANSDGSIYYFDINNFDVVSEIKYSSFKDSVINPNFRSLALNDKDLFAMTISDPAILFKNGKVVYKESHPSVFYDSMEFWNNLEGIAVGDFTENCISIIITRDGGETWNKLDCSLFENIKEGEGFFAASDTNISIINDKVWLASGGINSRIYFSDDKGVTWKIFNTPIIQGESTTGIFSIDFYDEKNGFGVGGDYTKPEIDSFNKIRTNDGGKTWQVVGNGKLGYRSCVQYFPGGNGKKILVVGFKGIDYSSDSGNTWIHLSDDSFYTVRFLNDSTAFAAGREKISKLVFK